MDAACPETTLWVRRPHEKSVLSSPPNPQRPCLSLLNPSFSASLPQQLGLWVTSAFHEKQGSLLQRNDQFIMKWGKTHLSVSLGEVIGDFHFTSEIFPHRSQSQRQRKWAGREALLPRRLHPPAPWWTRWAVSWMGPTPSPCSQPLLTLQPWRLPW